MAPCPSDKVISACSSGWPAESRDRQPRGVSVVDGQRLVRKCAPNAAAGGDSGTSWSSGPRRCGRWRGRAAAVRIGRLAALRRAGLLSRIGIFEYFARTN